MSEQSEKESTIMKEVMSSSEKISYAMDKELKSIEVNEVRDLIKLRT